MSLREIRRVAPLLALAAWLGATTVPEMSFDEVVRSSSAIVHGTVVHAWSAWDPERSAIWTHYRIQVQTPLKGGSGSTLTVSEPGGEIDGKQMRIVGAPRYEIGDEVVVFASPTPIGYLRTCGWGQGKFEVRRGVGAPSGRVVRAGLSGVELIADPAKKAAAAPPAGAADGSDLDAFLSRVRAEVAAQHAQGAL